MKTHMKIDLKRGMKPIAAGLSLALAFQLLPSARAQNPPPLELNIVVVDGDGASGNSRQRAGRDPVVRVEDENRKALAGVAVVFTLPTEGATGEFGNGSKTLTVVTDSRGEAVGQGLRLNQVSGKVPIHVNVSYRGLTGRTNIMETNVAPPGMKLRSGGGSGRIVAIVAVLGAAAAAGAVLALRNNNNNNHATPPTVTVPVVSPIGLTPGTGAISGPSH